MGEDKRGILLVAHGSEIAGAERDVERVAAALRRMTGQPVGIGYLSFTAPDLPEAVLRCSESGIAQWAVLPYFLTAGYLQRKAMGIVKKEAGRYPGLFVVEAEPFGRHPLLVDLVLARLAEAVAEQQGD